MSSLTVRQIFKDNWNVPGVPLILTINESADFTADQPSPWATFAFAADLASPVTMGSNPWIEETGVASVFIGTESGDSDTVAAGAAEEVRKFWHSWVSPDGNVWVSAVNGPRPLDPEAQGVNYALIVDLIYTYQFRGA